ncbi:uncharacterized protein LOC121378430 [Gigantopelta aegis]|uniref:uncharacterized protein LOC121378430 n=1 Tax=Gigantopelta aegis TaxID=1735272 RepID=UPI001B88B30B|nr:uncharacterized protein LOC121378430 [Gigantopelta aegis]
MFLKGCSTMKMESIKKSGNMKNAMLSLVLIVGLIATVHCACDTAAATTCITTLGTDTGAAGTDVGKFCSAYNKYLTCLAGIGCSTDPSTKSAFDTAKAYINKSCNSGAMATASVLTMFLTLFVMLFK